MLGQLPVEAPLLTWRSNCWGCYRDPLQLDLDVYARRQVETHEASTSLGVDQRLTLVRTHLEVLAVSPSLYLWGERITQTFFRSAAARGQLQLRLRPYCFDDFSKLKNR